MFVVEKIAGFFGRHWRALLIWMLAIGLLVFFVMPNWESVAGPLGLVAVLLLQLVYAMFFMIVQFGALMYFMSRGRTYWVMPGETGVGFKDYRGQKDVLEVASRWVTLLRGVKEFKRMGGEVSKGLLLVGPPGTGKSYLAQCIATEAGVPFGYTSASSFRQMFMGMDVMTVWRLYGKARKLARKHGAAILFIDEIDSIGAARAGMGGAMAGGFFGGGSGALNQLLLEMDPPRINDGWRNRMLRKMGLLRKPAVRPNVVTMAATNIVNVLDPALLRAGRFDRKMTIDRPDEDGRKDIIEYYLSKVRHEDMPLDRMSQDTIGYSPVEIKYVINEATVVAHFNGRDAITYFDFTEAREAHEHGIKQPIRSMKLEEKRRLAYHEAGHAFAMATLARDQLRVSKATILRQGGTTAMVTAKPTEERVTATREELMALLQVSLASRAAEELFLETRMDGFGGDLANATQLAQMMLGGWGMGGVLYSGMPNRRDVEELLDEQYLRVKTLLALHADTVHAIAQALIANGELIGDDVIKVIEEKERERQSQDVIAREDTRRLAYHEAGHAIAEALLVPRRDVRKVSIVSSIDSMGANPLRPLTEHQTYSRDEMLAEIQVRLGGRAAEQIFLNTVLDGSAIDLKRAADLARYVVTYLNPDSLFVFDSDSLPRAAGGPAQAPDLPRPERGDEGGDGEEPPQPAPSPVVPPVQQNTTIQVVSAPDPQVKREARELLQQQFDTVKQLLKDHENEVHNLARALAEKGELTADEVRRILNGKLPPRLLDGRTPPSHYDRRANPSAPEVIGIGAAADMTAIAPQSPGALENAGAAVVEAAGD